MNFSKFSFPTAILFGAGAVNQLPEELRARGMHKPLLITDQGLTGTPVLSRLRALFPQAAVFSAVDPNPTEKNVLDGGAF